jgi:GNAT superfamily N-acetyltransferase
VTLTIRPAESHEGGTVADLWNSASAWLRSKGQDQWQYPVRLAGIQAANETRTCWLVEDDRHDARATVTLDTCADPRLWFPEDQPDRARYVHRLVVTRDVELPDLGSAILDWASDFAARDGALWLRLDAWTSNTRLHKYYLDRGFDLVRTSQEPDVRSGVLFERRAGFVLGLGPLLAVRETRDPSPPEIADSRRA